MSKKGKSEPTANKKGRNGQPVSKRRWMIETAVLAVLAVSIVVSFIVGVGAKKIKLPFSGNDVTAAAVYRVSAKTGEATMYEISDASLQTQLVRAVTDLLVREGEQPDEQDTDTYVVRFTLTDGSDYVVASAKDASNYKDGEFVLKTDVENGLAPFCTADNASVQVEIQPDSVPEGK